MSTSGPSRATRTSVSRGKENAEARRLGVFRSAVVHAVFPDGTAPLEYGYCAGTSPRSGAQNFCAAGHR
jgi:hypothetical protein